MIYKILFNNKLPFPNISFSLFLSCLIISIPILLEDVLYAFLGANVGLAFPWQYLTSVFAHGPEPPTIIHLLINLSIIVFCVSITEKLLGTWRVFLLLVITALVLTFIRFETYSFYNGISSFIFVFAPFSLLIWIYNFNKHSKKVLSDVYSTLTLLVLFSVFILYPIFFSFIDSIWCERNMLHFTSIIFGVIFLFVWRKIFSDVLKSVGEDNFQKIKPSIWDRISRILAYIVTILNLLILLVVLVFFD